MLDLTGLGIPILIVAGLATVIAVLLRQRTRSQSNSRSDGEKNQVDESEPSGPSMANAETSTRESSLGYTPTQSVDDIEKAREELRALDLEKQITAAALTTIFEAEIQAKISRGTRDGLVENYKAKLKALDEQIAERKKVTELSDLMSERDNLIRSFEQRIAEIDERLKQINAHSGSIPQISAVAQVPLGPEKTSEVPGTSSGNANVTDDKPAVEVKNRTEERMKAIREEVLKAIERLEKIESEG